MKRDLGDDFEEEEEKKEVVGHEMQDGQLAQYDQSLMESPDGMQNSAVYVSNGWLKQSQSQSPFNRPEMIRFFGALRLSKQGYTLTASKTVQWLKKIWGLMTIRLAIGERLPALVAMAAG